MDIGELVELMKRQTRPEDLLGRYSPNYAQVYTLTDTLAVKVYRRVDPEAPRKYGQSLHGNAQWEYTVGKSLYVAGLNVPQYFGLATVSFSDASMPEFLTAADPHEDTWYLFMQRIHATPYEELTMEEREVLRHQFYDQARKAYEAEFESVDYALDHNTLFDRSQQKLYFIDFVRWKKIRR